jgi:hypothetical protein
LWKPCQASRLLHPAAAAAAHAAVLLKKQQLDLQLQHDSKQPAEDLGTQIMAHSFGKHFSI